MNNFLAGWFFASLFVGGIQVAIFGVHGSAQAQIERACGPCNHVAECGDFKCEVGVEGWHE